MPGPSETKLTQIRTKLAGFLPDKVYIIKYETQSDGRGGTRTREKSRALAKCHISAMGLDEESIIGDALSSPHGFNILFAYGTNVTEKDELLLVNRNGVALPTDKQMKLTVDGVQVGQSWQVQVKTICSATSAERLKGT